LNSSGFSTINDFNTDLNSQTQSEIEVTSFFFQDQIDVSKYLKLLIGGRHDNFNITVKDLKNGTAQAREDTEFSPRAGIIFKPTEKASFYFSYSESFLPRSGEQFKSLSPISAALDPDIFESSEIGIKMDVSDNLNFTLAYFDSEQLIAARDSMSGETSEIVGLQVDGLELEVKGEINNRMNVVFGYSSLDGRTFKGGEPREIPDSTLSLFATYEVSDNFSWALGYIQQGESNIANDNPDLILPKFTRVDLGAYYQMTSDFSIQINIENLMDELYFPHSHSTHQVSVGEPLNIRVSARKTF
jgi:catecholate siderophore receptor